MTSRVDFFVELPDPVKHKVSFALANERSRLGYRVFHSLVSPRKKFPYSSTMDLVRDSESPSIGYIAKTLINPYLNTEGYVLTPVIPEKAIIDSYGHKSRQRYWGFVEM
ncbi:hypothetical protein L4D13_19040 [Photobacterium profundum]|uniref:hypothetical protein n=1 Tax=Photobacterium profundum TaxID=74109 RepID=UPI003D10A9DB